MLGKTIAILLLSSGISGCGSITLQLDGGSLNFDYRLRATNSSSFPLALSASSIHGGLMTDASNWTIPAGASVDLGRTAGFGTPPLPGKLFGTMRAYSGGKLLSTWSSTDLSPWTWKGDDPEVDGIGEYLLILP